MDNFIARQPIFDSHREVFAYELLHRSGWSNSFRGRDGDRATVELMNSSLLVNRLPDLTDGKLAFVNVPQGLLVQDVIQVLPSEQTVIEILEAVRPEPEVLEAVDRLRRDGYRIALDDFIGTPDYEPLVARADFLKIDFQATSTDRRQELVDRYAPRGIRLLAEKVETREELDQAQGLGYELFQGYFFCRPETRVRRDLPRCKVNHLDFLREVTRSELDLGRIEETIKRELSLSTRLLRYLNSVQFGVQSEISSIHQALVHIGEQPLRRWGTLIAMTGIGDDKPQELVRTSLVRARFCELLAVELSLDQTSLELFLAGMFSAIDALLDRPMAEALKEIGVGPPIQDALLGDHSQMADAVELAQACERGDWRMYVVIARRFDVPPSQISELYASALLWADRVFSPPAQRDAA